MDAKLVLISALNIQVKSKVNIREMLHRCSTKLMFVKNMFRTMMLPLDG